MSRRRDTVPAELIDIDGEGIYLHEDLIPSPLIRAAHLFLADYRRWREIDFESFFMLPSESGDEWIKADIGRFPVRGWRLNLPHRWFPVERYLYCTPKHGAA